MNRLRFVTLSVVAIAFCASQAKASILDQINNPGTGEINSSLGGFEWQQQVTAGIDGTLESIEFFTRQSAQGSLNVYLNVGSGWQTDTHEFFSLVDVQANTTGSFVVGSATLDIVSVDVSGAGITLAAGDQFILGFEGLNLPGNPVNETNLQASGNNAYADPLFFNGSLYIEPSIDIGFRTYMQGEVPEPASLAIWAALLGGVLFAGNRKRLARLRSGHTLKA